MILGTRAGFSNVFYTLDSADGKWRVVCMSQSM
jgi:hypothetical protein